MSFIHGVTLPDICICIPLRFIYGMKNLVSFQDVPKGGGQEGENLLFATKIMLGFRLTGREDLLNHVKLAQKYVPGTDTILWKFTFPSLVCIY